MLEVRGLETFYGASQALFGIDFCIAAGEAVTLLGRNGMGKTTTINSIMGIVRPRAGEVRFEGAEVSRLPSFRTAIATRIRSRSCSAMSLRRRWNLIV